MYFKVLFNDQEIAKKIMQTNDPKTQKKLGRSVKHFDGQIWNEKCREIVRKGNMAKVKACTTLHFIKIILKFFITQKTDH